MKEAAEKTSEIFKAVGRRKTAIASVWMKQGKGIVTVNDKEAKNADAIIAPLVTVGKKDSFDVTVKVSGGGKESQKDAIIHGIARSIEKSDPELRITLKKAGFLTRDPREKERKKPGLKGARRSPQWAKR